MGGRDVVLFVFVYIDGEKYWWVFGDKVIFIMYYGIIVKIEGLDYDLYYMGNF